MTKIIGIAGWKTGDNSFGVGTSYLEFLSRFGRPYIISPFDVDDPPKVDLLVLPGGADINPLTYNEIPSFMTGQPNLFLEFFDEKILPKYLENDTPILGICRGAQKLYSIFGGRLIQHNGYHKQSNHKKDECHDLQFTEKYRYMNRYVNKVTSRHHQTMDGRGSVPESIDIIAFSNEKNGAVNNVDQSIVEIFKHNSKPIYGVQYHPEDNSSEELTSRIILDLLGE